MLLDIMHIPSTYPHFMIILIPWEIFFNRTRQLNHWGTKSCQVWLFSASLRTTQQSSFLLLVTKAGRKVPQEATVCLATDKEISVDCSSSSFVRTGRHFHIKRQTKYQHRSLFLCGKEVLHLLPTGFGFCEHHSSTGGGSTPLMSLLAPLRSLELLPPCSAVSKTNLIDLL